MLSINEVKELLGDPHLTDAEAEELRDACYELAEIIVEAIITRAQGKAILDLPDTCSKQK